MTLRHTTYSLHNLIYKTTKKCIAFYTPNISIGNFYFNIQIEYSVAVKKLK